MAKSVPSQRYVRNRLLAALPAPDYEALRAALEPVSLTRGDVLIDPGQPFTHALFVETGVVSAVAKGDNRCIEIGLVGRDGFVGVPLALGVDRSPHESIVQIGGEALRLPGAGFADLVERHPAIRALCLRYAHLFQLQTAQTALSNGSFALEMDTVTLPSAPALTKSKWLSTSILDNDRIMLVLPVASE